MSIMAIFANSPFDKEKRIDCKMLKLHSIKNGEICILPNFHNAILEIKDNIICIDTNNQQKSIKIHTTGIAQFKDNVFTYFGGFTES